jgi:hypothetical protein
VKKRKEKKGGIVWVCPWFVQVAGSWVEVCSREPEKRNRGKRV